MGPVCKSPRPMGHHWEVRHERMMTEVATWKSAMLDAFVATCRIVVVVVVVAVIVVVTRIQLVVAWFQLVVAWFERGSS